MKTSATADSSPDHGSNPMVRPMRSAGQRSRIHSRHCSRRDPVPEKMTRATLRAASPTPARLSVFSEACRSSNFRRWSRSSLDSDIPTPSDCRSTGSMRTRHCSAPPSSRARVAARIHVCPRLFYSSATLGRGAPRDCAAPSNTRKPLPVVSERRDLGCHWGPQRPFDQNDPSGYLGATRHTLAQCGTARAPRT